MSNCSVQGSNYRKQINNMNLIEGFSTYSASGNTQSLKPPVQKVDYSKQQGQTQAQTNLKKKANSNPNIDNTAFNEQTDIISKKISQVANSQNQLNKETNDYLSVAGRDSKYADKIVKTDDGIIGYVTKRGIFKPFDSVDDANATLGKNGCPANIEDIKTKGSTYTDDGVYLNTETPIFVGTSMVRGQQCGYAGQNVFVNQPKRSDAKPVYDGCKSDLGDTESNKMISTGLKMDIGKIPCPVGTFTCNKNGYCYDPKNNQMVSTYMIEEYDSPIGETVDGKSKPYLADDGVTYLWPRLYNTFDKNACKFDKPDFLPCPKGTAPCSSKPGVCWDPERKIMATTISPYDLDINKKPLIMILLQPQYFTYNENTNNHFYYDYNYFHKNTYNIIPKLQRWKPDDQFSNPKKAPQNKVYEQFKSAAAIIMKYLDIGESHKIFYVTQYNKISWKLQPNQKTAIAGYFNINGQPSQKTRSFYIRDAFDIKNKKSTYVKLKFRGDTTHQIHPIPDSRRDYEYYFIDRNFGDFIVTKINNTTANCVLKSMDNSVSLEAKYTFDTPIPKVDMGFIAKDGYTRMWKKQDGYDETCGAKPSIPPVNKVKELIEKCKTIANNGGFKLFGIRNGECLVGNSSNSFEASDKCQPIGDVKVGTEDAIATYSLEGASNKGLYQYGYVSADEKLKIYSFDGAKKVRKFRPIGKQQILKTPRSRNFDNVSKPGECEAKCFSVFGDNCEAYSYNRQTKACSIYGKDALREGKIIPGGSSDLMIRAYDFNKDTSCPDDFKNIDSSVWGNLPIDGFMNPTTKCNLAHVVNESKTNVSINNSTLNSNVNEMKGITSDLFKSNKVSREEEANSEQMKQAVRDLNTYNTMYGNITKKY